ncbi:hypothetical protein [uncultured Ruegeria sp.]|uniref:DUF7146 domain-containing protein n=1 Tax=uncultured Ruegeria sp. TaxID=259304 RepID=UPI00261A409B|nr:hypothetical protein [uncultured Ruegeria sp.]
MGSRKRPIRPDPDWKRRQEEDKRIIIDRLNDRVEDLAERLLPEGRREGHDWRAGSSGGQSIRLTGPKRGVYTDFRQSDKGTDLLGAIQHILCNGSFREAISWARGYLGMDSMTDQERELEAKRAEERREQQERQAEELDAKRRRQASGVWHSAKPIKGTMAETYLQGRAIDLDRLARVPGALRFSSEVWCRERKGEYPAMVASLWRLGDPHLVATHRTYLARSSDGRVIKAPIEAARSTLGSWPGAIIPIQRGESDARWKDIEEGDLVAFGEGIEEGLSVALVKPDWRVGAVGYSGNFARIELPVWCHVMLCVNNDPPGSKAHAEIYGDPETGRAGAIEALTNKGHVVRALRPPAEFADWNDLLQGKTRGRH